MSVSVKFRTTKQFKSNDIVDALFDKGVSVVWVSQEFPCLKFGTFEGAIRGVEINAEEDGYEVRVCSYASTADYELFAESVNVMSRLTDTVGLIDDDEDSPVINAFVQFNKQWIDDQHKSSSSVVSALVSHMGKTITMPGLYGDICIGPKILSQFGLLGTGSYSKSKFRKLQDFLCLSQEKAASCKGTDTRMILADPDEERGNDLSISMIVLKDNQIAEFDYISNADVLCLADMDKDDFVFIPMEHAWKILSNEFVKLDELQFYAEEKLTVSEFREMLDFAKKHQPSDLHKDAVYPGQGYDESQNTFILTWNPAFSSAKLDAHNEDVGQMLTQYFNWSVWDYEKARYGDRFYLVRCGQGNTGVVMSGVFVSNPYQSGDWSGRGRVTYYMDMYPNVILNPDMAPMITTLQLQKAIPSFDWTGGRSGRVLNPEEAKKMELLWADYIKENSDKVDGMTLNMVNGRCEPIE